MGALKINKKEFEKFSEKLHRLYAANLIDDFYEACAKELAARLLAKVIKKTPVGLYPKDPSKKGGTLRRGWTGGRKESAKVFADTLSVEKNERTYKIMIENNVEYAPYVEYGHRTRGGKGFVEGKHMLEISEKELEAIAPKVLERKLKAFLKGAF